jgi:hypothetical protein
MVAQVTVNDVVYVKAREFHPKGTCHAHKNFTRTCTIQNVKDDLKSVRPQPEITQSHSATQDPILSILYSRRLRIHKHYEGRIRGT